MAEHTVSYGKADSIGAVTAVAITTAETLALEITDFKYLDKSQLTNFFDIALGDMTSVKIRYYYACGRTVTGTLIYYEIPVKNLTTGVVSDTPTVVNSTTPVQGSNYRFIEDIPCSGAHSYKVTVQGVGGTAGTLNALTVFGRDN